MRVFENFLQIWLYLTQNNRYTCLILKLWWLDGELKIMKNGENQKFLTWVIAKIRNIAKN